MKRLFLLFLLLSSVLAYDITPNENLLPGSRQFIAINAAVECAILQDGTVRGFCEGTCSLPISDDFSVLCPGHSIEEIDFKSGPPFTVTPSPSTIDGTTHYIQGISKNEWGIPVKSVIFSILGNRAIAISDSSGRFSINVPDRARLQVLAPAHRNFLSNAFTSNQNLGIVTLSSSNPDMFKRYGIADYCRSIGCTCEDFGLVDCLYDENYLCLESGVCCPSERNCFKIDNELRRVDTHLSIEPTELALTPGEIGKAEIILRSNIDGQFSLSAESENFPIHLPSSTFKLSAGIPLETELTVSYPHTTTVRSETILLKMRYEEILMEEKNIIVGILTPDASIEEHLCTKDEKIDCIFKISNTGSFPIDQFDFTVGKKSATLNITIQPNDYLYYRLNGLESLEEIQFSYTSKGSTWTESKRLRTAPLTERVEELGLRQILGEVFKSIFG